MTNLNVDLVPNTAAGVDTQDDVSVFEQEKVKGYPKSNRKLTLQVREYETLRVMKDEENKAKSLSVHISPHGIQFHGTINYPEGTLLKIDVAMPDYWQRKQKFVDYTRIDSPGEFKILAKVVKTEEVGKRGKKKLILAQTVNIDEVDEQVLRAFLSEGR